VTLAGSRRSPLRDQLLVALADPEAAGRAGIPVATLVAFQEPIAVLDWLGAGKDLVLLDQGKLPPGELGAHLDRVLDAYQKGLLFIAIVGGGAEVEEQIRAADARARGNTNLGFYHAEENGQMRHVLGRRLVELEKVGRALPECGPLTPEAITAIAERGQQERRAAMAFVRSTSRRFPYATVAMIVVCVMCFAITAGGDERSRRIYELLANTPDGIQRGELWRLFTYALLHDRRSPVHLMVNMLSLYSLGAFLEPLLGRWRIGLLCGLAALTGGVASAALTRAPSVGASGAVWGLVGATLALLSARRRIVPAVLARILRHRFVVVLLLNVGMSFIPGIDRYCHFGGGLAGYLMALAYVRGSAKKQAAA
jgi:membrane associated rhomboid family serine protease